MPVGVNPCGGRAWESNPPSGSFTGTPDLKLSLPLPQNQRNPLSDNNHGGRPICVRSYGASRHVTTRHKAGTARETAQEIPLVHDVIGESLDPITLTRLPRPPRTFCSGVRVR